MAGYPIQVWSFHNTDHNFCISNGVVFYCRHDKCWGSASGGAWLPNAVPSRLSVSTLRDYARVLEQRPHVSAHFRDSTVEVGRLLHDVRLWVQGRHGVLEQLCTHCHRRRREASNTQTFKKWNLPQAALEDFFKNKMLLHSCLKLCQKSHKLYSGCYYYSHYSTTSLLPLFLRFLFLTVCL